MTLNHSKTIKILYPLLNLKKGSRDFVILKKIYLLWCGANV